MAIMKRYEVVKECDGLYCIAQYDEGYSAYITNDGIYGYYHWGTEEQAQEAADAYNEYDGACFLHQHGYGADSMTAEEAQEELEYGDPDLVRLYNLFGAIDPPEDEEN